MPKLRLHVLDDGAPAFAEKVVEILNSALTPATSSTSPEEAAKALDHLRSQDYTEHGTAGSFLWWFWDLFHDLACQVPHDSPQQEQITAVVKALHDLPPKTVELGQDWGNDGGSSVQVWTHLPMFANTFGEKVNNLDSPFLDETQNKERRVNLQTYAARIAGHGLVPLEMHAIWALVDALEGTMQPVRGAPDEVDQDPNAIEDITHKVQIAAGWIRHAGHILYGRDEPIEGATAGPLWKLDKKEAIKQRRKLRGTDGLSPERWLLWKQRFAAIRDAETVPDTARTEAAIAFDVMDGLGTGNK